MPLLYVARLWYGVGVLRLYRPGPRDSATPRAARPGCTPRSAPPAVFALLLSVLLAAVAAPPVLAQVDHWGGDVVAEPRSISVKPGESVTYTVRLNKPPTESDGSLLQNGTIQWFVMLHIDGVRYQAGVYKDLTIVPSFYRSFTKDDWGQPKTFRITRKSNTEWDETTDGPRAGPVQFTHEVWDHHANCPVHGRGSVNVHNSGGTGGNGGNTEGGTPGTENGGSTEGGAPGTDNGGNTDGNNDGKNGGNTDGGIPGKGNPNDARPRAVPALSISDAAATEGGTLRFRVTLSPSSDRTVSVDYETADGSAEEPADYNRKSGTLTFERGERHKTVEVETLPDDIDESNETLTVTLSMPQPEGVPLRDAVGLGTVIGDVERRIRLVDRAYLPEMGRAAAFNAVRCGVDQALSRTVPGSLKQALDRLVPPAPPSFGWNRPSTHAMSLEQLLGSLSFALQSTGRADGVGRVAAWSCADYRGLADGGKDGRVDWDGRLLNTQIGADVRLRPDLLAGLALSRSSGSFRYEVGSGAAEVDGKHELRLNGIHPHMVWSVSPGLTVWGTVGHASGDLDIRDGLGGKQRVRNAALGSAMAGVNGRVLARGKTTVTLKGEAGIARFDVARPGDGFGEAGAAMQRLKFAAEAAHEYELAVGGSLSPWAEVGLRHDGGDGETGAGIELGGGMRYRDPAKGWTAEGFGRRRMVRGDALPGEWGFGAAFRIDPDASGTGFSASLTQSWGEAANGTERLWDQDAPDRAGLPGRRLELEAGYGVAALRRSGVLTPFAGMTFDGDSGRGYRWGGRLTVGPGATLSLEAERREPHRAEPVHRVMLRGMLRF